MKCIKCGVELPVEGKYCPSCGAVNDRQVTAPPVTAKSKTRPIVYATAVLGAIGLVALIVAVVMARNGQAITAAPAGRPGASENVMAVPPGKGADSGIMAVPPGNGGKGDLTPSSTPKPKPTPAMVDYLNYVKTVEKHRQILLEDTTNALTLSAAGGTTQSLLNLIDMAGDPDGEQARDPLQDTKSELSRQYKNWIATLEFFDKKPAPAECREFSAAYRDVLFKETKAIGDIAASFNSVNVMNPNDMSKLLTQMQKLKRDPNLQGNIDKAADNADHSLDRLVANYDMEKPFDVPREKQTSGNIMGF